MEKIVKVRKEHQCWSTGKTIKKGERAITRKFYPAEAKRYGMIDVCVPITLYIKLEGKDDN